MAFLVKSERKIDLNLFKPNEVGPGQYLSQDTIKQKSPAKVPFNSSTNRENIVNKNNNYPGVGSYEYDDRYEKLAKFIESQKQRERSVPLYKTLENTFNTYAYSKLLPDNHKSGFGSMEKRFKNDKSISEVPGPGFYSKEVASLNISTIEAHPKKDMLGQLKKGALKMTGSPQRVLTIPDKYNSFGYETTENGRLVMNEDPDKNLKYLGRKSDTVGPGTYNVIKQTDWVKNSHDWSKSLIKNNISKLDNNLSNLNSTLANSNGLPSLDNSKQSNSSIKRSPERFTKENLQKQLIKNRKIILNKSDDNPQNDLEEKVLFSDMPGPAYYSIYNDKKKSYKPEKFQIFGSSSPRFPIGKIKDDTEERGPGFYYKDDIHLKYEKMKVDNLRKNIGIQHNTSKKPEYLEKHKQDKEEMVKHIGPGLYEPHIPQKKPVSNTENFGSLQRRFVIKDSEQESRVGPGSYSPQDDWKLDKIRENKKDFVRKYYSSIRKDDTRDLSLGKDKMEVPPVGTYDSDVMFSMGYKAAHNPNPYQSVIAPFSSMQKRFEESKVENQNLGPGLYFKEKKKQSQQIYPPFKQGDDKNKINVNGSFSQPGPGNYEQNNYFDWNKKSFNIHYI